MSNTKKKKPKNYTLKKINKNYYVYSWSYIKKSDRINLEKRFDWKYRGPVDGDGGNYIESLNKYEKKKVWEDIRFKEVKDKELSRIKKELTLSYWFNERVRVVKTMEICEEKKLLEKELKQEISKEAQALLRIMFKGINTENYQDFLDNCGTVVELRERIHI